MGIDYEMAVETASYAAEPDGPAALATLSVWLPAPTVTHIVYLIMYLHCDHLSDQRVLPCFANCNLSLPDLL